MSSMRTPPIVESYLIRMPIIALLLMTAGAGAQTETVQRIPPEYPATSGPVVQQLPAQDSQPSPWQQAQSRIGVAQDSSVTGTINTWRALQQSDGLGFSTYASFIVANPGWPGEDRMRRLAETGINPDSFDPNQVAGFFARFPARTATGHARNAVALMQLGRMDEARVAARNAWIGGSLSVTDEARLLSLFGSSLTPADHDQRADALLWANDSNGAARMIAYVSPARRAAFQARIAFRRQSPDAASLMQAAEGIGASDAGYIADKAAWLRDTGNWVAARQYLANRGSVTYRPSNAEKFYELLLGQARAAANDSQWSFAYGIASKIDDAIPPGTDVSIQPIGVRDDYTSLAWLAGSTAFYNLNRPTDAVIMFRRYADAAKSPQTRSKGYYWAGRAALQAGDQASANSYFSQAGVYPDQFYGQLALERLGRPIPAPATVERPVPISAAERAAFDNRTVVRAVRALGQMGYWEDQSKFARAIANNADSDVDHYLAAELAQKIGRPDMGVMVGRRAVSSGLTGYGEAAFPRVPVPSEAQYNWTMVHAIARQESQFDRQIVSHAGARGLMQLMPGTAREQAGKLGMSYNPGSLNEPSYNIMLGSGYFQRMLDYYGGSYPLAVAAYNAGPGNVNKWVRANGDPRMPGADMLRWIEQIPIFETRNYVQRVLENAVVYEAMNPERAKFRGTSAVLSRYLGKQTPG
ncbi:lytic transglycosylase domain-containing protein [Sphingobium limneticum]|uniref:Lytic transglycosylase domain-containing protein n=1 Tax=Sphingobium limneticum TaxID=1007511 RepID=A0A5J5I575_9SPHN|nr:lytic transglycosylase domain-containing protein [Sphingobium limneticum]KAA9018816.1 lytic transglycosylase domain-containing protein [Sphingobium limneticum]KAA9031388.1 lytic transglycosylase domain-containing protein [Sphingobium limneticum]